MPSHKQYNKPINQIIQPLNSALEIMKNPLANPKTTMWICRLAPIPIWILTAATEVFRFDLHPELGENPVFLTAFAISMCPYFLLIWGVLPNLLYEGEYKGMLRHPGYFLFSCFSAGLGPVLWYWIRIDPRLRDMALIQDLDKEHKR